MQLRSMAARNNQEMKILVADDDPLTRRLLQETLEHAGYEVIAVADGRAAALEVFPAKTVRDWHSWIG